jgi:hypothetical protein
VHVLELPQGSGFETAHFFAAQVLYNKVCRHWHRCAAGVRLALRQRLCVWLASEHFATSTVRRRLCLCLAAVAVRSLAVDWPSFASELPSLFRMSHPEHAALLIDLLRYLPEELEQAVPFLGEHSIPAANQLNLVTSWMMDVVRSILASGETTSALKVKALECLHSWTVCDVACSPTQLQNSSSTGSGGSFGASLVVLMRSGLLEPLVELVHSAQDVEIFVAAAEVLFIEHTIVESTSNRAYFHRSLPLQVTYCREQHATASSVCKRRVAKSSELQESSVTPKHDHTSLPIRTSPHHSSLPIRTPPHHSSLPYAHRPTTPHCPYPTTPHCPYAHHPTTPYCPYAHPPTVCTCRCWMVLLHGVPPTWSG